MVLPKNRTEGGGERGRSQRKLVIAEQKKERQRGGTFGEIS